ncbi:uncharacterized protein YacL [Acetoanaerobium pronyense]|uniref:Uncharacterized protein YacL n=1 Tax=Acetoanaerobium pronyense TaxID=1482736 RepID=A0ABS4KKQ1_9FIRM|nr:hypothetical protein [Acetoanaerobium pronyense]MBP2028362.1 uncharacterized protein YacL [Acetoanaerobium pronyense]
MEKIHFKNIIKSFFLGVFIGIVLQINDSADASVSYRFLILINTGTIGLIIGFITEWITSKIPITLANSRNYFLINNIIALIVTTCILIVTLGMMKNETSEFLPILRIVLGIVLIANIADYIFYIRTQRKLKLFKGTLKEK